ncbi:MAG: anaerobic ribonucleoside-triphosphate reductase activating protein [Candidatus Moranbacteria bacterium]|nr:anaerobic ribonucleoside-triphosphate reductase activating protein [Candidatus Moranbacteria bacterium]
MLIAGHQKLTLIDYPGRIATTVFTAGCNFRCPFCHNPELVSGIDMSVGRKAEKEFFEYLKKRKGKIEGVCITGGEPTIQKDIVEFIRKVNDAGYLVKLDTNGLRPDVIKKLLDLKLIDFIAMDIKNQLDRYDETVGVKVDKERIRLSVELIMRSGINYEFRTTAVPGIHTEEDFLEIAKWIRGAKSYYLQNYREGRILDEKLKLKTKGKTLDLARIKDLMKDAVDKIGIRG